MLRLQAPFILGTTFMLGQVVRDAIRHSNLSLKQASLWQEIDQSQLERQLNGVEHLSLRRMEKLPLKSLQWFFWLGLMKVGLPKEVRRAAIVQFALMGNRRMLRLEQAVEKAEQTA